VWPVSETAKFIDAYSNDVVSKRPLYVVERSIKGGTYRFFADFDLSPTNNHLNIKNIVEESLSHLPESLRSEGGSVTVCVRECIGSHPKHKQKLGAHLIWSDDTVRVGDAEAMQLRDEWIKTLGATRPLDLEWDAIIDKAVYRSNGLRMPWSLKSSEFESVYIPRFTYDLSKQELCTVHPGWDQHDHVAFWVERCSIRALPSSSTSTSTSTPYSPDLTRSITTTETQTPATVTEAIEKMWGHRAASSLQRVDDGLFSCRSKKCFIKGGEHRSNHVYFQIKPCVNRGFVELIQYCHSEKCRDYFAKVGVFRKIVSSPKQR